MHVSCQVVFYHRHHDTNILVVLVEKNPKVSKQKDKIKLVENIENLEIRYAFISAGC